MAKIKFDEYLKSKTQQVKTYESDEALVRRARLKMSVDPMVVSPAYRVQNLEAAYGMLEDVKEYPGASKLKDQCHDMLEEAHAAKREADYRRACLHLSEAGEEHEFEGAAREFAALGDYRDSGEKKTYAQARQKRLNLSFQIRRGIVLAILIVAAVFVIAGARAGYGNYVAARLEGLARQYESAYNRFTALGDLLDSEDQAEIYYRKYLRQREAAERKSLPSARKGDTVAFGSQDWLVLKRHRKKLLLICVNPSKDSVYRDVQFHNTRMDVTWEDSFLREYLNGGVLRSEFTELEQAAMVEMEYTPSENPVYGTEGSGNALKDKIRIFDTEDLEVYSDVYTAPGEDMWLSTPGHDLTSACVQSKSGLVMSYGDDVTDANLSVCPVIEVDLKVLKAAEGD